MWTQLSPLRNYLIIFPYYISTEKYILLIYLDYYIISLYIIYYYILLILYIYLIY